MYGKPRLDRKERKSSMFGSRKGSITLFDTVQSQIESPMKIQINRPSALAQMTPTRKTNDDLNSSHFARRTLPYTQRQ